MVSLKKIVEIGKKVVGTTTEAVGDFAKGAGLIGDGDGLTPMTQDDQDLIQEFIKEQEKYAKKD